MDKKSKILVTGCSGMVGSAILRLLEKNNYENIIAINSKNLDLRNQNDTNNFFRDTKPEYVFVAAAKVGGILANSRYKAEFLYDNLMIEANIINAAHNNKAKKLLFLGSSCIYPKFAKQPIKEEYLLTGELEPTNDAYALAKIAGIKLCETYKLQYGDNFISAMPTNLYGPNDNYDLENSHVLPALIRKFVEAKENNLPYVTVWGTGNVKREFLHVDDLAEACLFLMNNYNEISTINIGTGVDMTIKELSLLIKKEVNYSGEIVFDSSKPDGTPRKLLDVSKINQYGWKHKINIEEGIRMTIDDFIKNKHKYIKQN